MWGRASQAAGADALKRSGSMPDCSRNSKETIVAGAELSEGSVVRAEDREKVGG